MPRKKKTKNSPISVVRLPNLPTQERMDKGYISIRDNIGLEEDPLRIDKLLKNAIIDEMQHLYGMQIITYWRIASRPFIRTASYEPRIGKIMPSFDAINISRMSAEDKFYKVFALLNEQNRQLITKICFEELPAIEAGKQIGLPINSITMYVRAAFDALGDALAKMRQQKRQMEKEKEGENQI